MLHHLSSMALGMLATKKTCAEDTEHCQARVWLSKATWGNVIATRYRREDVPGRRRGADGLFRDRSAEELSREYGLPQRGAIVSRAAEGGPAEEAGIKGGERVEEIAGLPVPLGDVVTQIEDDPVSTPDDLIKAVNSLKPSDNLNLTVVTPEKGPARSQ